MAGILQNIICCLKEKESFIRITGHFKDYSYIGFEEYVQSMDEIKDRSLYRNWQYAVIDKNLPWCEDAVRFFKKMGVPVIYFDDDYFEVISSVKNKVPEPATQPDENKPLNKYIGDFPEPEKIRYIEKQKVVEKKIYTSIEKKIIIVSNLTRCAGSTTITLNLAKYLSNLNIIPAVVEPPIGSPTIFHWMAIEEKLNKENGSGKEDFYSYPHEIWNSKTIRAKSEYIFDGIVWIVADDRKEIIGSWDYNQMIKLIYATNLCPITLIDIGSNLGHDSVKPVLSSVDIILIVIDPFPSSCMRRNHILEEMLKLRQEGFPIHFIVNKWNGGVENKEFLNYLGCEPVAFIPAISLDWLYKANYGSIIPYEFPEVSDQLNGPLKKISSLFMPVKFIKYPSSKDINKQSIISRLKSFSFKLSSIRES